LGKEWVGKERSELGQAIRPNKVSNSRSKGEAKVARKAPLSFSIVQDGRIKPQKGTSAGKR